MVEEEDLVWRACREAPPGEYWGTEALYNRIEVDLVLRNCREGPSGEYWGNFIDIFGIST